MPAPIHDPLTRLPSLVVPLPLRAPDLPLLPLIPSRPLREPQLAPAQPRRLAAFRVHPVRNHMHVGLPVPVRHDQRLVPLQPQRLQAPLRSPKHLLPVRLLLLGPVQRVVAHRLLQLAPGRRRPCQAFELRRRLRRDCHDPRRPIPLLCGQVAGLRPLHPLCALRMPLPRFLGL